jgi:hypothetical protein
MFEQIPKALRGLYLFPIEPGTKDPALRHGWHGASNDPAKLQEWAALKPDYNWAVATGLSGLCVFDVDPDGIEWWSDLVRSDVEVRQAVEKTLVVKTPRGGLHVYFDGEGATTASRIAKGIDTRGGFKLADGSVQSGGYVLLPGSRTSAGTYEVLQDADPIKLPARMFGLIPERKKTEITRNTEIELDLDRNVQWVREILTRYVAEGRVSVEGAGGNDTAFRVACAVMDKGLSHAKALELLQDLWNPHCSPPWSEGELERILVNASEYGDDTNGSKALPSNQEAFAAYAGLVIEEPVVARPMERARVQWLHDFADNAPEPSWLIPNFLPSQGVGMLYGDTGSFKTFVALDIALCLAHGVPGQWGAPPVKNDVVFLAGEAAAAVAKKRWPAWMQWQNLDDRTSHRFLIKPDVPLFARPDDWAQLREDLATLEVKPKLIVIDTLAKMMVGMDENSSKEAGQVWQFMEELAAHYECMVLFLHHTGKDHARGARGASLFSQNAACSLALKRRNDGTELYVKKLKDAEYNPDRGHYMRTKEVGPSIVLEMTNETSEDAGPKKGSRYPWAEAPEIVARISAAGGQISHAILTMEIASEFGVDISVVKKVLGSEAAIQFLKDGNQWTLPAQEHEYDL